MPLFEHSHEDRHNAPRDQPSGRGEHTGEHEHRREYRRKDDRDHIDALTLLKTEPLTIKRLAAMMALFVAINQGIAWWRANNVTPESLKATNERIDKSNDRVDRLSTSVDSLTAILRTKQEGDNFFYYSICYSWRQKFPRQYPAFCDRPEIRQFDPLGQPVPSPR